MHKTNPMWLGRRVDAQNKPNLGQRGKKSGALGAERHCVSGQPPIRSGAGSTKRRNVQNEPNLLAGGPTIADCGLKGPGRGLYPRPGAQNEPNLGRSGA
jgi:hypothetical protein